jgi:hypothetical protein
MPIKMLVVQIWVFRSPGAGGVRGFRLADDRGQWRASWLRSRSRYRIGREMSLERGGPGRALRADYLGMFAGVAPPPHAGEIIAHRQ